MQPNHKTFLIIISFSLLSHSLYSQHVKSITHKLHALTKKNPLIKNKKHAILKSVFKKKNLTTQKSIIRSFSETQHDQISREDFLTGITILHNFNASPYLATSYTTLLKAIPKLFHIDGFSKVMKLVIINVHNAFSFNGYVYEIETGYNINNKENDEKVLGFQKNLTSPKSRLKREFDIVTSHRLIECKNINQMNSKIKRQLEIQKQITDDINSCTNQKLTYQLQSKNNISKIDQQWLQERNIAYSSDNEKKLSVR